MTYSGPTREPEENGLLRRGLFARREPSPAEPITMSATDRSVADAVTSAVEDRLEHGLQAIEEQATVLMREIAGEIWRSSARDVRPEQERILTLLSRDQAIRSLIASTDERFQALASRQARLEDHLTEVARAGRETRDSMDGARQAIREIANSPTLHGVEIVRTQLEQVEQHIAETFAHIEERDQRLSDTILTQVREHGELVANETTRVVEAMQAYVQSGTEAIGRLAEQMQQHAEAFVAQDHDLGETVRGIVGEQTAELSEQLDLVAEKVGLHARDQAQMPTELARMIDVRVRGLAELIRSDSLALRNLVQERTSASGAIGDAIDEAAVIEAVDRHLMTFAQVMTDRLSTLERSMEEQVLTLSNAATAALERNMDKMSAAAGSVDGLDEMVAETQQAFQDRMFQHIDDRVAAVARMIRSDNTTLAKRLQEMPASEPGVDAETLRQVLRGVKELQAGVSDDVVDTVDRRLEAISNQLHRETQSQAEAMVKVAEILSEKIDRLAIRVDEGVGNDLQIVVDRMSDAIRAMSTVQRRPA
jgi:hypothetical protein